MLRLTGILVFLWLLVPTAVSQSVPRELLEMPTHLELDRPTQQVSSGSTVTYTVTLKNTKGQPVKASSDLRLEVETPSGQKTVMLPAGQSSANFTWQARSTGVAQMSVRSGKLHPASGLVLVLPSPRAAVAVPRIPARVMTDVPKKRSPAGIGARVGSQAAAGVTGSAAGQPAPPPPPTADHASKIQLYVEPLPVYGNAVDHIWKANVSVAALGAQDSLAPVPSDVPIHFNATSGRLSTPDIVLPAGQFSNFDHPVVLTTDRSGKGIVNAVSSLGPAGPVEVQYLQPPPAQLRLSVSTPVLAGTGSSTAGVQVCLLDESGGLTSSNEDITVTLTAPGQLTSPTATIHHGLSCSDPVVWTAASGPAVIRAEAEALKADTKNIVFPAFPWYFVWLAAVGGLLGALVFSSGRLFSRRWWSHTWRGLVLGAILGAVFYLFARFGAIALPKESPINIQNIPVVSGVGSFLLGFVGGLYGRKLWKVDEDKPGRPKPPAAGQAAGGSGGRN